MAIQPVTPYVAPASAVGPTAAVPRDASDATQEQSSPPTAIAANPPSRDQLNQAMSEVRKALAPVARNLQFSIDDETGRSVVKVVDSSTNEVIRQIPSEELLAITRSMDKLSGLFVKQKA
jgi:flagellar protein FlaG